MMKKLKQELVAIFTLLIASLIFGGTIGIYLYSEAYQSFKDSYLPSITEETNTDENMLLGSHNIGQFLTIDIIGGNKFVFDYNNTNDHIFITCTLKSFQLICILFPSLIFFAFLLLIYIPIIIVDIIKGFKKKNDEIYNLDGEHDGTSDKLNQLPNNISIYALILLRFNKCILYESRKDFKIYLSSNSNKQNIDELVDEYINNFNNYNSYNPKTDLFKKINSMLYEELYQAGYVVDSPFKHTIKEFFTKMFDETLGYILNWKRYHTEDEAIFNQENKSSLYKAVFKTILEVLLLVILLNIIPHIIFFLFLIIPYFLLIPPFKLTAEGKKLKKQLRIYELTGLMHKSFDEFTPQENLYSSVANTSPFRFR